ncbi:MAG TPA: hypothetical protein VLI05_02670 [Candidatus Saccharimonadia bacterium]|nr:hypothetical protein [Candidatus Saccharimonadia bacterium]
MATTEPNTSTVSYHSNPLELIRPSINGVGQIWLQYVSAVFLYLAAILLSLVIAGIVAWVARSAGASTAVVILEAMVVGLILLVGASVFFMPAFYRIILAAAHHKQIVLSQAFEDNWNMGVRLVLTQLLAGVFILAGLILLIVPGLILIAWFAFVPYVVIEEKLSGLEALRRSRDLGRGRLWEVWGVLGLGASVGILNLVPVIGGILNAVAAFFLIPATALRYLELQQLKASSSASKVPVNGWNYGLVVIALLVLVLSSSSLARNSHPTTGSSILPTPAQNRPY